MNFSKLTVDEILFQAGLRINNSISDAQILTAVTAYGYDAVRLSEGVALLGEAEELVEAQKREYGELDGAQDDQDKKREQADTDYMSTLALCKIAFKKDVKAISTLDLTGRRASTFSGWLKQTKGFYNALLANEEWKTALLNYGQTAEKLQAQRDAIEAVSKASETKKKEMGDAQNSTKVRDEKLEELVEWVNDYEVIAKIALAESPQLLEKLGIVVAS